MTCLYSINCLFLIVSQARTSTITLLLCQVPDYVLGLEGVVDAICLQWMQINNQDTGTIWENNELLPGLTTSFRQWWTKQIKDHKEENGGFH